jgi:cell fate regulator YaaT (PSP1 superfamily)
MVEVIGVRFPKDPKIYYYNNTEGLDFRGDDWCVVEIDRGVDLAQVVDKTKIIDSEMEEEDFPKVVRKATEDDFKKAKKNSYKEKRAYKVCLKKINERGLPMKLVDVHWALDGSKITFYFTADGRVDFRELVKDLAHIFKTRIELRQIGVRDEAKLFGGFGWCGRPLCCTTFLQEFDSVLMKMAKDQNLILSPSKISGVCGRLMCCLAFEWPYYKELRAKAPKIGEEVKTKKGKGVVVSLLILQSKAVIEFEDGRKEDIPFEEIKR